MSTSDINTKKPSSTVNIKSPSKSIPQSLHKSIISTKAACSANEPNEMRSSNTNTNSNTSSTAEDHHTLHRYEEMRSHLATLTPHELSHALHSLTSSSDKENNSQLTDTDPDKEHTRGKLMKRLFAEISQKSDTNESNSHTTHLIQLLQMPMVCTKLLIIQQFTLKHCSHQMEF